MKKPQISGIQCPQVEDDVTSVSRSTTANKSGRKGKAGKSRPPQEEMSCDLNVTAVIVEEVAYETPSCKGGAVSTATKSFSEPQNIADVYDTVQHADKSTKPIQKLSELASNRTAISEGRTDVFDKQESTAEQLSATTTPAPKKMKSTRKNVNFTADCDSYNKPGEVPVTSSTKVCYCI